MKTFLVLFLFSLAANIYAQTERACTAEEATTLRRSRYRAAVRLDSVKQALEARLARNDMSWGEWRKLHVAKMILSCARGKLGVLNYVCADNFPQGLAGYTVPVFTNKVYIDSIFFTYNDTILRESLVVHEASHHCGTSDAIYLTPGEAPRDSDYVGWQVIADTYTYWMEHGFCMPGEC